MKNWKAKLWLAAFVVLPPWVVSADSVSADGERPAAGSLTLQWTLSGRRDPLDCGPAIDRLEVSLSSSPGDEGHWDGPCDAFQLSIDLPPGTYTGDAILVDRLDRPISISVPLDPIDIVGGRDVVKSIDFPVAAFL